MPKKPTTYNIGPKEEKKPAKEPKSLRERLPAIIILGLFIAAVIGVIAFVVATGAIVQNDNIHVTGDAAPTSTADISDAGFTATTSSDNSKPKDIVDAMVGDTFYSYCKSMISMIPLPA